MTMNYAMPKQIGDHNKNQMISVLREKGRVSRVELSRLLGISATAVTRNVTKLLENCIIRECGAEQSVMGRKPVLMELCRDNCYVIGADVVGGTVKVALADLMGELVKFSETPIRRGHGGRMVFDQLLAALRAMVEETGIPKEKIWSIVAATPGVFYPERGRSDFTGFLDGWDEIDLRGEIHGAFGIDTVIENDVNLDVIGESWKGGGKNFVNVLYVKLGQGLASRIVLQEKLLRGENRLAGEIGFMRPGTGRESYENMLCNDALSRRYAALAGEGPEAGGLLLSDLLEMRAKGNGAARQVIGEVLDNLAVVVLNSVAVLDPQVIILGGDASGFTPEDIAGMKATIEEAFPVEQKIIRSSLNKKAGIHGAIRMGLDRVEERIIALL